nr:MAG TPA: protein of unknown function (DUF4485) [Caudoviricetes sp.]
MSARASTTGCVRSLTMLFLHRPDKEHCSFWVRRLRPKMVA